MIQKIKEELSDFKSPITLNSGKTFDHYEILRRIDCYADNTFIDDVCNEEGLIFWQLAGQRLPHFVKNIDLDTKDFRAEGQGEANYYQSWIVRMKFEEWCRKGTLPFVLNNTTNNIAKYGSGVWKKTKINGKTELKRANLNKLYFDTSAEFINDSSIIEEHELTEDELRFRWSELADEIILKAEKFENEGKIKRYKVYERHGYVDGTRTYGIYCGLSDDKGLVIYERAQKKDIYFDFHIADWAGDRWLRVGVFERLFQLQEDVNTLVNQNQNARDIASLLLLRTNDPNTYGNVLKGAESGDIIQSADLQQIGIDNRFFNEYITELREKEAKADKLCMTPDVITGDTMPSGTTMRGQAMTGNAAKSAFLPVKQSIGEKMGKIIVEEILPEVVMDWNKGGYLIISENSNDIAIYDEAMIRIAQQEQAEKNGGYITKEEAQAIEQTVRQTLKNSQRKIDVKKNFFNFDTGIKLNVTGESIDKAQQNDAYNSIITWMTKNPAIVNNPYFRQYAENNGITFIRMETEDIEALQQGMTRESVQPQQRDALMAEVNTQ
jgi:hypothetical protein